MPNQALRMQAHNHKLIPQGGTKMTNDQEIRAKALEIAVQTLALLPEPERAQFLKNEGAQGRHIGEAVVQNAKFFEDYLNQIKP
jgi:hypothetical protein